MDSCTHLLEGLLLERTGVRVAGVVTLTAED